MQVRFLSRYRSWRPFHQDGSPRIYCVADGQANVFIKRGLAEEVIEEKKPKRKKQRASNREPS